MTAHREEISQLCGAMKEQAQAMLNEALDGAEDGYANGAAFVGFYAQVVEVLRAEDRLKTADRCIAFIEGGA